MSATTVDVPSVSIIVPVLGDDAALAALLPRLRALEPAALEILVIDGAASAALHALCKAQSARWVPARPGRGEQLRLGAAQACGEVLWFVHADADIDVRSLAAIGAAVMQCGAVGGYFRFRFGGPRTLVKRLLERCIAWRCRFGIAYGDQALFVTRAAYDASPGFAAEPLFEEVALQRALKRSGRFIALPIPVTVSPRRWERDGWLTRTLANRLLALGYALGIAPAQLASWYGRGAASPSARQARREP